MKNGDLSELPTRQDDSPLLPPDRAKKGKGERKERDGKRGPSPLLEQVGKQEDLANFKKQKLDMSKIDKFAGTKWGKEFLVKLCRIAES